MPEGLRNVSSCYIWSGTGSCLYGISFMTSSMWFGWEIGVKVPWGWVEILGTEAEGSAPGEEALFA